MVASSYDWLGWLLLWAIAAFCILAINAANAMSVRRGRKRTEKRIKEWRER